jgi:hypothetical protein
MLFVTDFILYTIHLTMEVIERFEEFKLGGQVICTVQHADDRKLNPGLPWQKQLSERRRPFSSENWT